MTTIISEQGLVLTTHPLRESDLIASLLVRNYGKISCVVRGARRSKKRFLGGIDIFDIGTFELQAPSSRYNLYTCNNITERESFLELRSNLNKFIGAAFCNELASAFCTEADSEATRYFDLIRNTLRSIDQCDGRSQSLAQVVLFFTLCFEFHAGFDPTHGIALPDHTILNWWREMLTINHELPPPNTTALNISLSKLVAYTEETLDKRLNTSKDFLTLVHYDLDPEF